HPTDDFVMFYSDGGDQDKLWKEMADADYMINMPVLKAHARAGITVTAKNHFGSHSRTSGAWHLHRSLPSASDNGTMDNGEMGSYRCFVDITGHKDLGGKTMLYLVDALWATIESVEPPQKWQMAPFNDDWTSSILASQDPMAIESVCFDFLYEEYSLNNYSASDFIGGVPYPHQPGVQDYIHQCADPANWPADVQYDPENDGTVLTSLGVHEHWNNSTSMQYTRNLGSGDGIELVKIHETTAVEDKEAPVLPNHYELQDNYPNPFNPTTHIEYHLDMPANVQIMVYNIQGELIRTLVNARQTSGQYLATWDGHLTNGILAPSGKYFYQFHIAGQGWEDVQVGQMVLLR
ncbi:DUF362 domain-containing protein, partial [bacterium]